MEILQRLVLVMLVVLANPKFKSTLWKKEHTTTKLRRELQENLQPDEQPRTMECPVSYFKIAGESGTVLCRIARWECLGTLLLLFIG